MHTLYMRAFCKPGPCNLRLVLRDIWPGLRQRAHAVQLPQPAALYHNDCQHIGNQMLSLPYTYAPKLAQLAPSAPAQLVDAAQRLKQAGSEVLSAQVCYDSSLDPSLPLAPPASCLIGQ